MNTTISAIYQQGVFHPLEPLELPESTLASVQVVAQKGALVAARKMPTLITSDQAIETVQDFIADHLGNLVDVAQPSRIATGLRKAWIVPLVLTSPGYGIVGVVGTVMLDEEQGDIIGWTPVEDIRLNAEQLTLQKQTALEAAFFGLRAMQSQPVYIS